MNEQFAQGDLLIEHVTDVASGTIVEPRGCATVLAEGEATGHRHAFYDNVVMFRDDRLVCDIPPGVYVGHVRVPSSVARLEHDEHAPVELPMGTYCREKAARDGAQGHVCHRRVTALMANWAARPGNGDTRGRGERRLHASAINGCKGSWAEWHLQPG